MVLAANVVNDNVRNDFIASARTLGGGSREEVQSLSEAARESKPLHPSWTAKKQQQTAIQQFQGQKITFDSD